LSGLIRKAALLNARIGNKRLPASLDLRVVFSGSGLMVCISLREGSSMPQSPHDRTAELHNLASHAHDVAAVAHGKTDHRTAHELSKQAHELSQNALKHSEQLDTAAAESTKAETGKVEKVEAARTVRPGLPG
jgi:hypothetical protein